MIRTYLVEMKKKDIQELKSMDVKKFIKEYEIKSQSRCISIQDLCYSKAVHIIVELGDWDVVIKNAKTLDCEYLDATSEDFVVLTKAKLKKVIQKYINDYRSSLDWSISNSRRKAHQDLPDDIQCLKKLLLREYNVAAERALAEQELIDSEFILEEKEGTTILVDTSSMRMEITNLLYIYRTFDWKNKELFLAIW